jgi:hypothetical protein
MWQAPAPMDAEGLRQKSLRFNIPLRVSQISGFHSQALALSLNRAITARSIADNKEQRGKRFNQRDKSLRVASAIMALLIDDS